MTVRRGRSLRWQLTVLILGLLLPTLIFVSILLWQFAGSERGRIEEEARGSSRNLAVALDREIIAVLTTLQALATSPSLQSGELASFYGQIMEVRRIQGIDISLRSAIDGKTVLTTRAAFGTSVSVPPMLAQTDQEILRTNVPKVSDIFRSTTTGQPVFQIVAAPVLVEGIPTYTLGASIDLNYLVGVIRKERLPTGWLGAVIDRNGIFVVRTERHADFAGKSASPTFIASAIGDAGSYYGRNSDGRVVLSAYARSALTGWLASASLPIDAVNAPLRRSLLTLVALGLTLGAIATAIALQTSRSLGRAFAQLTRAASAIGHGHLVAPVLTPVSEINQVGLALQIAAQQLKDRVREREDAQAALRDEEERLRLVVEGAKDHAILTTDPTGTITSWSAGATAIFGWPASAIVGRPSSVLFTPEDRDGDVPAQELATAARDGYATDQRWHLRRDGSRVFLNGSVHPLAPDGRGHERGFLKVARDETERLGAELALRELNETLEAQVAERTRERNRVWETTNDLVGVGTFEGRLKAVNPAWTTLLGWTEDELLTTPFVEFVDPADHASLGDVVARLTAGERLTGYVDRVLAKDGSLRTIMWTAVPALDERLFYMVGRDLTEIHQTEEALRQAQKMEAVGQLTGGIAHDFNNLLTAIMGSLELLGTRIRQGRLENVERYMTAAQGAASKASALTHRLLAFSRRQTLDPKPTDVNRLAAGLSELIRRTVGPAITVEVVEAGGLWSTLVDQNQLENALLNLCINARDAMPDGGRITIETANKWLDPRIARERDMEPGQYVSLCVSDTGTGMPSDVIAKAFDPFFTTKPIGFGTGLGLSMVYGFARQSGGQVRIYSEMGHGTNVCVYLPRHNGVADPQNASTEPAEIPRAEAGQTVLVVDDEPTVRMLVTEVLEELGYTAIEAADGAAGLKILQSDVRLDLLVSDVGLPGGLNGRQMADAGRVLRPDLQVLFITGYAENAVVGNGHLGPGMHVLTKPFAMDALASRIKELIAVKPR